jgi:hypothetical protein
MTGRFGKRYWVRFQSREPHADGAELVRLQVVDDSGHETRWKVLMKDGKRISNAVLDDDKWLRRRHCLAVNRYLQAAPELGERQLEMFEAEEKAAEPSAKAPAKPSPKASTKARKEARESAN